MGEFHPKKLLVKFTMSSPYSVSSMSKSVIPRKRCRSIVPNLPICEANGLTMELKSVPDSVEEGLEILNIYTPCDRESMVCGRPGTQVSPCNLFCR